MCVESCVERSEIDARMIMDRNLFAYINKFVARYGATYLVSAALQELFYISDAARKCFVDRCEGRDVQQADFVLHPIDAAGLLRGGPPERSTREGAR